jgi:hypothetical protein
MTQKFVFGSERGRIERGALLSRLDRLLQEALPRKRNLLQILAAREKMTAQHIEDVERLLANAARWGCIGEDGKIDMVRYSAEYCVVDTQVLDAGMHTCRQQVLQALDIDIAHHMTISSVADKYCLDRGVFQGVQEVSGIVR